MATSKASRSEVGKHARSLILRLLNRRLVNIPDALLSQVQVLSLEQLEELGEALLDFSTLADLEGWLQGQTSEKFHNIFA